MENLTFNNTDKAHLNNNTRKYLKFSILMLYIIFMLVYMFRPYLYELNNYYITLFSSTAPNLIPSFIFTLICTFYAVPKLLKTADAIPASKYVWLVNVLNLSIFALIEYVHVVFRLGVWDNNDIIASLIGIFAATAIYFMSRKSFIN